MAIDERLDMHKILFFMTLALSATAAHAASYPAEELAVGTEIVVLQAIEFPPQSVGVWLQNGKVLKKTVIDDLKSSKARCSVTVDLSQYDFETGFTRPVAPGSYKVAFVSDGDISKGGMGWLVQSDDGKEFHLQCSKSHSLIADRFFRIRMKTVKKTLEGIMEIKD